MAGVSIKNLCSGAVILVLDSSPCAAFLNIFTPEDPLTIFDVPGELNTMTSSIVHQHDKQVCKFSKKIIKYIILLYYLTPKMDTFLKHPFSMYISGKIWLSFISICQGQSTFKKGSSLVISLEGTSTNPIWHCDSICVCTQISLCLQDCWVGTYTVEKLDTLKTSPPRETTQPHMQMDPGALYIDTLCIGKFSYFWGLILGRCMKVYIYNNQL